ncbi:MAG: trigger factor [Actinomycetes bacterium]|jgi:trigger factor|nr:trigger factor [Actinomycetes bacterium]
MFESAVASLDDGKAELTVTVDAQDVDRAVKKSYKDLAARLRVPGFRPGKAPRRVVEGQLGRDYVLGNALENLVNETYPRALDTESLRIQGKAEFNDPAELIEGEPYSYKVVVILRPELTLKSTQIQIQMPPREATDAEVDSQIEQTRERFATYVPRAKTAKIKQDSTVTISFTSTVDGEDYEGSTVENFRYTLGEGRMPAAFEEGLIGQRAGDVVAISFTIEDTGDNSEYAGKEMAFSVTVESIDKKELPPIDDALAVSTGFDSLEDMRKEIADYINSQKKASWERISRDRLLEALTAQLEDEPPAELIAELVTSRADTLRHEFENMLEKSNMTLEDYLNSSQIAPEQFADDMNEQARTSILQDLALEALARAEDLTVSDEELNDEFAKLGTALETSPDAARERWEERGLVTLLIDDITRRKAIDWLTEHATIEITEEEK